MIREHTIICDECSCVAELKNNNFYAINNEDICRDCVDSILAQRNNYKVDIDEEVSAEVQMLKQKENK